MRAMRLRPILKVDPVARRNNALREKPLPLEMLPKSNRVCGIRGHDWFYLSNMKRCVRHVCEVIRPYTPNEHGVGRFK